MSFFIAFTEKLYNLRLLAYIFG